MDTPMGLKVDSVKIDILNNGSAIVTIHFRDGTSDDELFKRMEGLTGIKNAEFSSWNALAIRLVGQHTSHSQPVTKAREIVTALGLTQCEIRVRGCKACSSSDHLA